MGDWHIFWEEMDHFQIGNLKQMLETYFNALFLMQKKYREFS